MRKTGSSKFGTTTIAVQLKSGSALKLEVVQGPSEPREYIIEKQSSIGNDPEADVYLNDPLICPRHARLIREGNWWIVVDLLSENGTFLNDKLVKKNPLFPNSRLQMGNSILSVDYVEPPEIESVAIERHGEWVELPSVIAHELKNYLQFFDAGLEQLRQDTEMSERYSGELKSFEIAGERMQELVQILRTGYAPPRLAEINFVDLMWEQVSMVESASKAAGIILETSLPDKAVMIQADSNQLGRAILNLLKNAIEACEKGDILGVMMTCKSEHRLTLIIRDTGKGMDRRILESMWTPMFTTKESGNGLGSFISRAIILKHNGRIEADSTPGKGTVIRIELPRSTPKNQGNNSGC